MIRLLSRVPRWLSVTLALVAAAALFIIAQLSPSLHGGQLALTLPVGALFAAIAIGLPELARWQAQQEARLKVRLEVDPSDLTFRAYADDERVIESLVAAEEAACVASVPRERPARRRRGFDAAAVVEEFDSMDTDIGKGGDLKGLTLNDLTRLIEKKESGVELTPEEERSIVASQMAMSSLASAINATAFSFLRRRPDTRTAEQYREEVRQHLSDYRDFLSNHLLWEYVTRNIGRLKLTLVNPTDRVFEGVQVEVYLPGRARALDPDDLSKPTSTKPARPRPFGEGTAMSLFTNPSIAPNYVLRRPGVSLPTPRPTIDNSASAKVTYPPVTLRPLEHKTIQEVVLFVEEPPDTVIPGTWEATATNAEGRVKGNLTVRVATTPLAVRELLAEWSEAGTDT